MDEADVKLTVFLRDWLRQSEARLFEHTSHMFRWLMATLFAANGSALVGLFSNFDDLSAAARSGLPWFAGGIVLSLCMGIASAVSALRWSGIIQRALVECEQVLAGKESDGEHVLAMAERSKSTWKRYIPSYIGILSLMCLIVGMWRSASAL